MHNHEIPTWLHRQGNLDNFLFLGKDSRENLKYLAEAGNQFYPPFYCIWHPTWNPIWYSIQDPASTSWFLGLFVINEQTNKQCSLRGMLVANCWWMDNIPSRLQGTTRAYLWTYQPPQTPFLRVAFMSGSVRQDTVVDEKARPNLRMFWKSPFEQRNNLSRMMPIYQFLSTMREK